MESYASLPRICPTCSTRTSADRFDLAVRRPDGGERHFFGLLATLCRTCRRFLVDPVQDGCLQGQAADAG